MSRIQILVLQCLMGALGAVLVLLLQSLFFPAPVLVVLDSQRLLDAQLQDVQGMTPEQMLIQADRFGNNLQLVLDQLHDQRLILLHPQAVVTPLTDVTDEVLARLEALKEAGQ